MIYRWRWLLRWLDGVSPTQCPCCGRWMQKQSMEWAEHRIGGWVRICPPCYRELYGE